MYNSNGNCVDIYDCANFVIDNNIIYNPGWRSFPNAPDYGNLSYGNGVGISLCNVAYSTISNNTVHNDLATNRVNDAFAGFN